MQAIKISQIERGQKVFVIHTLAARSHTEKSMIYYSGLVKDIISSHGIVIVVDNHVEHNVLFWYTGFFHDDFFIYDTEAEAKEKIREIFEL